MKLISFNMILLFVTISACADKTAAEVRDSIVKIFASQSPPNMFRPWEVRPAQEATGSGVVIEGGRILTNAHVVKDAQQIYVQPNQSSDRLDATVEYISEDCDLATLRIDDAEAIKDLPPIPFAEGIPTLQTKVEVIGYPTGGDTVSVTEGVVSRIEYAPYYGETALLRIQVDAAINPGNSGGAAVDNGKIVGIVFSRLSTGDNIGYLIPVEVIQHFLQDWSDEKFDGFPKIDLNSATLENPAMRDFLKLQREDTGVVVHRVNQPTLQELIQPWDVIAACEGVEIDNLGMIPIENNLRVAWPYLISKKSANESIKLTIIRDGERREIDVPTVTQPNRLIRHMEGDRPTYFIYGGIVFTPVTSELLLQAGPNALAYLAASGRLITRRINDYLEPGSDFELVATCSRMLPHKLNKGYQLDPLSVLTHVNETPIRNIKHLMKVIQENEKDYLIFRFEDEYEEKIVFEPKEVIKNQSQILDINNISAATSRDLRDLWEPL
ncbi:MAG: trypsin-like peptidase domain-containing protein [Phycisphaerae bacterium]